MRRSKGAAATAAAHRAVVATTALVLHFAALVLAEPFLLLNNPRPKCIEVKANEGISVNVAYEAPDLVTLGELDADGISDMETPPGLENADAATPADKQGPDEARKEASTKKRAENAGLDKQWQDRQNKAKLEQMRKLKGQAITDLTISITEKGDTVSQARNRFARQYGKPKPPAKMSKAIENKMGTVSMEATRDGIVEVCVQSVSASHSLPSLVRLSVSEDLNEKRDQEIEKSDKRHLGSMESTLRSLIRRMAMIQKSADYSKEQEYEFHETSTSMNRAIKIWPILHCFMLVITGITMARHMTSYLKGHHIY